MLGEPLDCLLPEAARTAHREHLQEFGRSALVSKEMGHRGQIWGRRRNGELFPAEASVSKIRLGGVTHFTAVLRDVTEQRRAEEVREALLLHAMEARAAAEAAEFRFAFLARASEVLHSSLAYEDTFAALVRLIVPELASYCVVDVVDEAGIVRRLRVVHGDAHKQPLADRLEGYPRSQERYLTRHAIVAGEAELIAQVSDELIVARAENDEHLAILRALAPASIMTVPLRARNAVLGAILFARDATAPSYTRADLALASELAQRAASALDNAHLYHGAQRAIRARDDVLGVVSHDLRNPLSVISTCATALLAEGFADDARSRETVRHVQQAARWGQRLIQDLLDVTSIEAGGLSIARRPEDPVVLVTRASLLLEELAAERGVILMTEVPDRLPLVDVDADRLLQALGNLIGNAVKFTPAGGTVRVGAIDESSQLRLYVSDDGPGIPDEDVPHVFDRFWTARRESRVDGTGIGLAIVRGIVDAHDGRVWVERAPSGGAMFNIIIPNARTVSGRA